MTGRNGKPSVIRPVVYQETISQYRIVNDAVGMGKALIEHCDQADPDYLSAAAAIIAFAEGRGNPERARANFIRAMTAAGVFVRQDD